MHLLPADIVLIRRGTAWMPFAPFIWAWQRVSDPTLPWSWAYHVEMVWDLIPDPFPTTTSTCGPKIIGYKAFSLQPPFLDIVGRKFSDIKISAYRLINRPDDLTEKFWKWGNEKILHTLYVLGWSTCGHPVAQCYKNPVAGFYKQLGIEMSPYPGPIEDVCKRSGRFEKVR